MKLISLETSIKEIIKNKKLAEVCNSVSNNFFTNPGLSQAETMSLKRVSALLGPSGLNIMTTIVEKANEILATLPEEEEVDEIFLEIQNSKGLEASISEVERNSHITNNSSIRPGQVWYDIEGKRIQAHGASVFFENGTYYWIGENKDHTTAEGEIWAWGVKIYSSVDLYNWKDEGYLIKPEMKDKTSILYPARCLDRPHLIYNDKTKKYVLWLKYMDKAHFSVFTSDSLLGEYELIHEYYRPFDTNCGDFDLAKDETSGQGYLYWEVNHTDVWAVKLDDEFTSVSGDYSIIYTNMQAPYTREGISHMQRNGKHYIFSSGMTGYVPNPSEVAISDDWITGYKVQGNPHVNDESSASFNSQISHIFKVDGQDKYIAIADRWVPEFEMSKEKYDMLQRVINSRNDSSIKVTDEEKLAFSKFPMISSANTSIANYVWLPIEFDNDKALIKWHDEWSL